MRRFRNKIFRGIEPWVGTVIDEQAIRRIVEIVCAHLLAERTVIQLSLLEWLGRTLSRKDARTLAWRMAANKDRIRRGEAINSTSVYRYRGPCVIRVIEANAGRHATRAGKVRSGARVLLELQTGPGAGMRVVKFWSNNLCSRIARNEGLWPRKLPLPNVMLLYGAYFVTTIEPHPSGEERIVIGQVLIKSPMVARNRKLRNMRFRRKFECPIGRRTFEGLPCYRCPVGADRCRAATHASTYIAKPCLRCHRYAYHVTQSSVDCINCSTRGRT